jgi:16S rRNA (guanine527-N7)-methyltransferase
MLRRTDFLSEVVAELGLGDTVSVLRGRAEESAVQRELGPVSWVVARAVAPLDRLARWCLPLLTPGGRLLAMKGASVEAEVREHRDSLRRSGATSIEIHNLGAEIGEPTWVVSMDRVPPRAGLRGSDR